MFFLPSLPSEQWPSQNLHCKNLFTFLGTSVTAFLFVLSCHVFVYRFLENLFFLIGSAYFVAGSYPEKEVMDREEDEEDQSQVSHDRHDDYEDGNHDQGRHIVGLDENALCPSSSDDGDEVEQQHNHMVLSEVGSAWKFELERIVDDNRRLAANTMGLVSIVTDNDALVSQAREIESSIREIEKRVEVLMARRNKSMGLLNEVTSSVEIQLQELIAWKLAFIGKVEDLEQVKKTRNSRLQQLQRLQRNSTGVNL